MGEANDSFTPILPEQTLREIAEVIPGDCRRNIVVIDSLAVGYYYLRGQNGMAVRTKDADCLLSPRVEALQVGVAVTERLFESGWQFRQDPEWPNPGSADTPDKDLPAVRLHPPDRSDWFIELLTVPESPSHRGQQWARLETRFGHFGLCSFGFLSLTNFEPVETDLGIYVARLATGAEEDAFLRWPRLWQRSLQSRFPLDWPELALHVGKGLRALLASEPDLDEARYTCVSGLLASDPPTLEMLQIAGQRLLVDAVEPLEVAAAKASDLRP